MLPKQKKWLGLKSEANLIGKSVSSSVSFEGEMYQGKIVAVLGGGDAALEEALALTEYAKKVLLSTEIISLMVRPIFKRECLVT